MAVIASKTTGGSVNLKNNFSVGPIKGLGGLGVGVAVGNAKNLVTNFPHCKTVQLEL